MEYFINDSLFEAFAEAAENVYIYMTDMSTGRSRWSKRAVQYFDLPGEYMDEPGKTWGEKVHPDDREGYYADLEAVFSGKKNHHSYQYRALNRYGKYIWLECKGTMIYDEQGAQKMFAGMMTRLDTQSHYDPLTGMLTRNTFYDYDFSKGQGVVLLLGIDNFRRVINSYGYNYGNDVLVEFSKRLADGCEGEQKALRFNGDEFMLILPDATKDSMVRIFSKVKLAVESFVMPDGRSVELTISAGAEVYPLEGVDNDEFVNRLELAMDYVKRVNRGSMAFYSGEVEAKQLRRMQLKKELKQSIANNFEGFELYFQPWIDAQGTKIQGCEALLRWKGETIKDSGPLEFIPVLEEDGGILEVGRFVMQNAMRQQVEWQKRYGDFKVSFNVSYRQFMENGYVEDVVATAKQYGADPNNMIMELTESCDVENPENLAVIFRNLREHGFHISLDDFGTGYASMELLKKLPADGIKIEHNFVRELERCGHEEDFAIIEALMLLCERLNCGVVVEGVENQEVDEIIRDMNNATYLQGYYYSKPICLDDFDKMLEEHIEDGQVFDIQSANKKDITSISFDRMVVNAMSNMYLSLFMFNLKEDTYQEYRGNTAVHRAAGFSGRLTGQLNKVIVELIEQESLDEALEFVNLDTLPERIKGKPIISQYFLSKSFGQCRMNFIPVRYDEQDNLENVLLAVQKL